MELNLPERLQKYQDLDDVFWEKFVDRFKSIINGSTFICYKEINEFNALSIRVEFRENDDSKEELIFSIMGPIINVLNSYYKLNSLKMLIDVHGKYK